MAPEIKKDRLDEVQNTGMTTFGGGSRFGSWFYPMGKVGRFFAKFFHTKAAPYAGEEDDLPIEDNTAELHPLAGDTVVDSDVIKSDAPGGFVKGGPGGTGYQPIIPEKEITRKRRYSEFESMANYPEISTAFDIYADDSTQRDLHGDKFSIETENALMKKEIEHLFRSTKMDHMIWDIVRNTAKFGDCFIELVVDLQEAVAGIQKVKILNPSFILRVENEYGYLTDFLQEIPRKNDWEAFGGASDMMANRQYIELDKNQIIHFRLQTSDPYFYPYGRSIAAGSRATFRSLKLMEDAMLIYRLQRAPERRIFYIDVGQMPSSKAEMYIERIKQKYKKEKYYDTSRNTINERYNPMSADEDFFVPVKGKQSSTKIETLPGAQNLGDVDDVKYFRDKLLAALKIPKDYIVEKDKSPERKANLSQLDVKFARTIIRVQKNVELGLQEFARRHLIIKGFPMTEVMKLEIRLAEPSDMFLKRQLEVESQRTQVVGQVLQLGLFSREDVYKTYYNLNDREIKEVKERIEKDLNDPIIQQQQQMMGGMGPEMGGDPMPGEEEPMMGATMGGGMQEAPDTQGLSPAQESIDSLRDLKKKYIIKEGSDGPMVKLLDKRISSQKSIKS